MLLFKRMPPTKTAYPRLSTQTVFKALPEIVVLNCSGMGNSVWKKKENKNT